MVLVLDDAGVAVSAAGAKATRGHRLRDAKRAEEPAVSSWGPAVKRRGVKVPFNKKKSITLGYRRR